MGGRVISGAQIINTTYSRTNQSHNHIYIQEHTITNPKVQCKCRIINMFRIKTERIYVQTITLLLFYSFKRSLHTCTPFLFGGGILLKGCLDKTYFVFLPTKYKPNMFSKPCICPETFLIARLFLFFLFTCNLFRVHDYHKCTLKHTY